MFHLFLIGLLIASFALSNAKPRKTAAFYFIIALVVLFFKILPDPIVVEKALYTPVFVGVAHDATVDDRSAVLSVDSVVERYDSFVDRCDGAISG